MYSRTRRNRAQRHLPGPAVGVARQQAEYQRADERVGVQTARGAAACYVGPQGEQQVAGVGVVAAVALDEAHGSALDGFEEDAATRSGARVARRK